MATDTSQSAIVRATALELLRNYGDASTQAVVAGASDPNALVRAAAAAGIDLVDSARRLDLATRLLTDSVRLVRISAARALASVPPAQFTAEQRRAFDAARAEFVEAQMAVADMPANHLNLGAFYQAEGRNDQAVGAYETSLRMDPYFLPARFNLATLYNQMGRNQDAERVLREGIARNPREGELYYSLGLLLAEEHRLPEAAEALGKSAQLLPARGRVRYNYALALQQLGRKAEARAALQEAYQITPNDPEIVYTLALAYGNDKQWSQAKHYAQLLATLLPGDPRPQQLLTEIQRQSGGR